MARVILITGGSRGIGAATAVTAAARGYDVAFCYRRDRRSAEAVAREIRSYGVRALPIAADVGSEADVMAMFQAVDREFDGIDALVNNAGILEQQARLESMDAARIQRVLAVNVTGTMICAREAVLRMSTRHGGSGGSIVNVSSVAARLGAPGEYIDYAASKGAVDAMTVGLAKEVADEGIRVNGVRPGIIYTDIHATGGEAGRVDRLKGTVPMKRGGAAQEVAYAILWLLSDEASYVSGTFVDVAGGR
ncbi:MAG: SDR family oxidoreductase [Ectothiorhodospiraceae bacterium]|jgi:NAD(P)-dependent dehydrogenase (short-subunit alcohol dehydrogenase family)